MQQAEALVKQRQIEFDGAKTLRTKGYRAEAEFAAAEAALATAKANLIRAKRDLNRTRIQLPYEGMVRSRSANLGQFVNPGKELGVVFATDTAEVRLPLTDQDLAFVDLPAANEITASGASAEGPVVTLSAVQKGRMTTWIARIVRSEILKRADGSEEIMPSKCDRIVVKQNDLLYFETWGGGGWGDPLQRSAEIVAADVAKGLVSVEGARRYGVVVDKDGAVDEAATDELRTEIKSTRPEPNIFDFGGTVEELRERCFEETGLEPPKPPVFTRRAAKA